MKNLPLDRLTLVILSLNRTSFLERIIDFWSSTGATLIIVEGGENPPDISAKFISQPNVKYFHMPAGLYDRIRFAVDLVSTEYVLLAGDDEFYVKSAVVRCLEELDCDGDLVACCGRAIGFYPLFGKVFGISQYPKLNGHNLVQSDSLERVRFHMNSYVPSLIYSVCRSKIWKSTWLQILSKEFPVYSLTELQFELCMSFIGQSKVVPHLMWLRSYGENQPIRGQDPCTDSKLKIREWWTGDDYRKSREEFLSIMKGAILCSGKRPASPSIETAISEGLDLYVENLNQVATGGRIKGLILDRSSILFRHICKMLVGSVKPAISNRILIERARMMMGEEGVVIDLDELSAIDNLIRRFHSTR